MMQIEPKLPPICFSPATFISFFLNQVFSLHQSPTSTITKNGKKGRAVRRNIIITNTDIDNGKLYVYHTAEFWYAERLFYIHFASGIPER